MDTRPPASPLAATHLESARTNSPHPDTPATRLESDPYAICTENPFRMTSLRKTPGGRVSASPLLSLLKIRKPDVAAASCRTETACAACSVIHAIRLSDEPSSPCPRTWWMIF